MAIIFYFSFFLVTTYVGFRVGRSDIAGVFGNPFSMAALGFAVVHGFCPAFQLLVDEFRYSAIGYESETHLSTIIAVSVSLFTIYLGYAFTVGLRRTGASGEDPPLSFRDVGFTFSTNVLLFLFVILPALAGTFIFTRAVFAAGYANFLSDRIGFSYQGLGIYKMLAKWLYVATFVLISAYFLKSPEERKFRRWILLQIGFCTLVLLVYNTIISSRQTILIVLLGALAMISILRNAAYVSTTLSHLQNLKIPWASMALFMCVIIGAGIVRHSGVHEGGFATLSYAHRMVNGAFGNHENLLWLCENDFEPSQGHTYYATLVSVVPRAIWKEKPVGGGAALKNFIYPGSYELGAEGNSSLTTGLVTEAFMNFRWFGVSIASFVFGMLLGLVRRSLYFVKDYWGLAIYGYSVVLIGFCAIYGEMLGVFTRFVFDMFPLIVVLLLCSGRSGRQAYEHRQH